MINIYYDVKNAFVVCVLMQSSGIQQLTHSLWAIDSKSMRHSPTLNTTLYNFTAPFVFKKQNKTLHWELERDEGSVYKLLSPCSGAVACLDTLTITILHIYTLLVTVLIT